MIVHHYLNLRDLVRHPTTEQLREQLVLWVGIMGNVTVSDESSRPTLYANYIGGASAACCKPFAEGAYSAVRWFEVRLVDGSIRITTRHQDMVVNSLARGFADVCEEFYPVRSRSAHQGSE